MGETSGTPFLLRGNACLHFLRKQVFPIISQSHAGRCNGGASRAKARHLSALVQGESCIGRKPSKPGPKPESIATALLK